MDKKKKLLITGTGGFIFGNFIRQALFNKKPYVLSSIDRVKETHVLYNIYVNQDHAFYIADLRDNHTLNIIVKKEEPDIIIHGASENAPSSFVSCNVVGTQNVIDVCADNGCKLIYVSTDEVFGPQSSEKDPRWTENSPLKPVTPFAASKAAGELLVKAARGLNYNIVRLSNVYGMWQPQNKLIPKIVKSVLSETPFTMYGKGDELREWTHVYDVCSAIFQLVDNWTANEVYNVSSNQEFMNVEVFQMVCNVLGKGHNLLKFSEAKEKIASRYAMNADKIKSLGWKPNYAKLKEGLTDTCQWYVSNQFVLRM